MISAAPAPGEAAALAATVRRLALLAHRLHGPHPDPRDARDFARLASRLRDDLTDRPDSSLSAWLTNLECRVSTRGILADSAGRN